MRWELIPMKVILKNLKTAIFDVMETMFFLLPDMDGDVQLSENEAGNLVPIHIGISGNPNYLLTFAFDKNLAGSMAVDLLGIDESELNDYIIQRCLKETANIYGGKFLLSFEEEKDRNITLPSQSAENIFGSYETGTSEFFVLSFNDYILKATIETVKKT